MLTLSFSESRWVDGTQVSHCLYITPSDDHKTVKITAESYRYRNGKKLNRVFQNCDCSVSELCRIFALGHNTLLALVEQFEAGQADPFGGERKS